LFYSLGLLLNPFDLAEISRRFEEFINLKEFAKEQKRGKERKKKAKLVMCYYCWATIEQAAVGRP
jgi:hypothetical protein